MSLTAEHESKVIKSKTLAVQVFDLIGSINTSWVVSLAFSTFLLWQGRWQNLSAKLSNNLPIFTMSSGVVWCPVFEPFLWSVAFAGQLATAEGPRTDCMWSATCWPDGSLWRQRLLRLSAF